MSPDNIDEAIRRRFESDRIAGEIQPIEDYLPPAGDPTYLPTLEELVHIELELSWKSGHTAGLAVEWFLDRFPLLNDREIVLRLLQQEYFVRTRYAQRPNLAEYHKRFPQWVFTDSDLAPQVAGIESTAPSSKPERSETSPPAIGKYRIVQALDQGGQAQVYRGVHPALGKDVVIKLATSSASFSAAEQDRLVAEGRILADLEHPNLARIYDLDFHEGRPFLVMEYLRGRTLDQYAHQQSPTPRRAAGLVAEVARALAVAHLRGVVHRDIKPRNILVCEDDHPRLIDFGLAQVQHAWTDNVEAPGSISGTVQYMAPEQARGEADQVDRRSDIFALGAVLYFLVTGEPPFSGKTVSEILVKAQRCAWDSSRLDAAGIPRRLRAICRRAMAAQPADRYARVEDMAADLEAVARPARLPAALAIALIALITAVVLATGSWKRITSGPSTGLPAQATSDSAVQQALGQCAEESGKPMLSVTVGRKRRLCELTDAVPLRNHDEIRIRASVPPGLYVAMFWSGSDGRLRLLATMDPATTRTTLNYPANERDASPITGSQGTECVLVCARKDKAIDVDAVQSLWGDPLPPLPKSSVLRLRPDRVVEEDPSRDLGEPQQRSDPAGEVSGRLEKVRHQLQQQFESFEGIAFAHVE